jgi:biopolymer transport protein ExbD
MAGGGGGEGEPEFQVAPMVDVLLVILIFFMSITCAQVLKVDKTITLPTAPDAQKKDNQRAEAVVNVRWLQDQKKGQFVFDDKVYDKAPDLVPLIKNAKAVGEKKIAGGDNPNFRIVIRADRDAAARYVSQAMDSCAAAGIVDVSFSTTNK